MTPLSRLLRLAVLPALALLLAALPTPAAAAGKKSAASKKSSSPTFSNAYESPHNKTRPRRERTQFIILHTTEGAAKGSLEKLRKNGECHYVVDRGGVIYRIVDRRRIAYHCGLSMWNGVTGLDRFSIGIEIVGEHNHDLTGAQYASLKYLLADLKRIYKVPDDRILTHSMVAYGTPNKWQKRNHRGRKRCGMLLADPDRRRKMGILSKPAQDPDLKAGRLFDADPELTRSLYGKTTSKPAAKPAAPAKPAPAKPAAEKPAPAKPEPAKPATPTPPAPSPAPSADNVIGPKRSAWDIARDLYNAPTTRYRFPNGTERKGSDIRDWKSIPAGTVVLLDDADENAVDGATVVGRDSTSVRDLVGDEALKATTFYVEPGAKTYRRGSDMTLEQVDALPGGTRVLVGYTLGGPIAARRRAFDICGVNWNLPETYYLTPRGDLAPGDSINERNIPVGSWVFYRK